MADSADDEIIELTQVVAETTSDDGDILELTQVAEMEAPLVLEDPVMAEGEGPSEVLEEDSAAQPAINLENLSQEQLDAAVERVIEKKFAQHIEKILFEVTETVIKREIAEIKAGLQKDLDDIDNA